MKFIRKHLIAIIIVLIVILIIIGIYILSCRVNENVLRKEIKEVVSKDVDYDYKTVQKLTQFIEKSSKLKNGKTISLTSEMFLFASANEIRIIKKVAEEPIYKKIEKNRRDDPAFL